jgi:hypothetical protein
MAPRMSAGFLDGKQGGTAFEKTSLAKQSYVLCGVFFMTRPL